MSLLLGMIGFATTVVGLRMSPRRKSPVLRLHGILGSLSPLLLPFTVGAIRVIFSSFLVSRCQRGRKMSIRLLTRFSWAESRARSCLWSFIARVLSSLFVCLWTSLCL